MLKGYKSGLESLWESSKSSLEELNLRRGRGGTAGGVDKAVGEAGAGEEGEVERVKCWELLRAYARTGEVGRCWGGTDEMKEADLNGPARSATVGLLGDGGVAE